MRPVRQRRQYRVRACAGGAHRLSLVVDCDRHPDRIPGQRTNVRICPAAGPHTTAWKLSTCGPVPESETPAGQFASCTAVSTNPTASPRLLTVPTVPLFPPSSGRGTSAPRSHRYGRHFLPVPYAQKFSLFGSCAGASACTVACPRLFAPKTPLFRPGVPIFIRNGPLQNIACCVPSLSDARPVISLASFSPVAWLKLPPGRVPRSTTCTWATSVPLRILPDRGGCRKRQKLSHVITLQPEKAQTASKRGIIALMPASRGGIMLPLTPSENDVSVLLHAWSAGDATALDKLTPIVYDELRRVASRYMKRERNGHSLQTTALVNEAYLRLVDIRRMQWQNRAHFFAVSAQLMRRILVDYARRHNLKRGGGLMQVSLHDADLIDRGRGLDLVMLDSAMNSLAEIDPAKGAHCGDALLRRAERGRNR